MANIPKTIKDGVFDIGKRIGKGSFGVVFNATMKDGKQVAIKFEASNATKNYLGKEIEVNIYFKVNSFYLLAYGQLV